MKLPGWQASTSTAMPRKSYSLQDSPAMVKPKIMNFVELQDPNDYMRLARAEASKYEAMGSVAIKAAELYAEVTTADETARAHAEVAKHAEEAAKTEVDLTYNTSFREPDGKGGYVYPWKESEQTYDSWTEQHKATVLERNEFKTAKARQIIEKGFSTNDASFRSKIQKFVRDSEISSGRAATLDEAKAYKTEEQIRGAFDRAVADRLWDPYEAMKLADQEVSDLYYRKGVATIETISLTSDGRPTEQLENSVVQFQQAVIAGAYGSDPDVQRKLLSDAGDLQDILEDRREDMQQVATNNFYKNWYASDKARAALVNQARLEEAPDEVYGSAWPDIRRLVYGKGVETGTPNTWEYRELDTLISEYRRGEGNLNFVDLEQKLAQRSPSVDQGQYDKLRTKLESARGETVKRSMKAADKTVASAFGFGSLKQMETRAAASAVPDDTAWKNASVAGRVMSQLEAEIAANPRMDVESRAYELLIPAMDIPELVDARGNPATLDNADTAASSTRLHVLTDHYTVFINQDDIKGRYKIQNKLDPHKWDQKTRAAITREWRLYMSDKGRPEGDTYMVYGELPHAGVLSRAQSALDTLNAMKRNLEIQERISGK